VLIVLFWNVQDTRPWAICTCNVENKIIPCCNTRCSISIENKIYENKTKRRNRVTCSNLRSWTEKEFTSHINEWWVEAVNGRGREQEVNSTCTIQTRLINPNEQTQCFRYQLFFFLTTNIITSKQSSQDEKKGAEKKRYNTPA